MKLAPPPRRPGGRAAARPLELARDDDASSGSRSSPRSPPASACSATTTPATAARRCPTGRYTVEELASAVLALLDELGLERVLVLRPLARRRGRDVARRASAPERIERSSLCCTGGQASARREDWAERAALVRAEGTGVARRRACASAGSRRASATAAVARATWTTCSRSRPRATPRCCEALGAWDFRGEPRRRSTAPTLVIVGAEDPVDTARGRSRRSPRASRAPRRSVVLADAAPPARTSSSPKRSTAARARAR